MLFHVQGKALIFMQCMEYSYLLNICVVLNE
jgi:hypothetical protein